MENQKISLPKENTVKTIAKDDINNAINQAFEQGDDKLLKSIITSIHYADLADYINFAKYEQRQKIIELLDDKINPEILLEFDIDVLRSLIEILGKKKFAQLVNKLDVDYAIGLLDDLTEDERDEILSYIPLISRRNLKKGLEYPKNSAGILMDTNFVAIQEDSNVGDVLDYLSGNNKLPEDLDEIFVVDKNLTPVGSVFIGQLIRNKKDVPIKNIMHKELQPVSTNLDQEEVSYIFRHYDLNSVPVVNKSKKMVGVIYLDQILDVVEEEVEEDIMKLGGVNILDIYSAFFKTATQRFPWLFFNLLTACFTSIMINLFDNTIQKIVTLAAIMPIVASMGGNAGTQTVTVAVRAIANKDITPANAWRVILKEIYACALNGILLGVLGAIILLFIYQDVNLCFVFALAVAINFTVAGFLGSIIPITLNKIGADPAIASSVLLTFLTDIIGFCLFLGLASLLIT
jgi:magnesium transporter